jgi:serine protease
LAPFLVLAACDQVATMWDDLTSAQVEAPGPLPLDQVALDERSVSGSLQAEEGVAALLAPEPVLVAPGEILVGARVEPALAQAAEQMGLAGTMIRGLRSGGMDALDLVPENLREQVRERAEATASEAARSGARVVLERLGVQGEIDVAPGGVVRVDLTPDDAVSPTSLRFAQQAGAEIVADETPDSIEWNTADRCPAIVTQSQLEADVALATRCTIQRLASSRQFEFVEPNFIATSGWSRPPERQKAPPPSTTNQPTPSQPTPSQPAPSQPTPNQPAPSTPTAPAAPIGGMPNDPLLALQWHYLPRGAGPGHSPGGAGFTAFWEANEIGSRTVRVAVIDTGLDLTNPDINGSTNIAPGIDLIANLERSGDGDGIDADAQDSGDRCGAATENSYHGTHVAGTLGAGGTNNRVGIAGGLWHVTIVPVRVLGRCGGELADIVSGIRWAAGIAPAIGPGGVQIRNNNPADIINMSLSLQAPCPASLQAAIDAAVQRGVVIVVAAGNKANQAALYAPANCNNVIVVAANDARGGLAFYSNFGPQIDIMAPGGDLFADSDGDGRPDGVLSTRTTQSDCYDPLNQSSTERCYYSFLQGTSMAAPHVSAALAMMAAETGLRGRQLEDMLFTRALSPIETSFGQIECARSRNAQPISPGSTTCARPSGRGFLDMGRAAETIRTLPAAGEVDG